jgi:hypothetical protein
LKLSLTKVGDSGLSSIFTNCKNIQHLELNRCTELTDLSLKEFVKELPQLRFLDLTSISGINLALVEEIKLRKPDLLLRQFRTVQDKLDLKDSGLRVPRRVIEKEKKKKGKKGKK